MGLNWEQPRNLNMNLPKMEKNCCPKNAAIELWFSCDSTEPEARQQAAELAKHRKTLSLNKYQTTKHLHKNTIQCSNILYLIMNWQHGGLPHSKRVPSLSLHVLLSHIFDIGTLSRCFLLITFPGHSFLDQLWYHHLSTMNLFTWQWPILSELWYFKWNLPHKTHAVECGRLLYLHLVCS